MTGTSRAIPSCPPSSLSAFAQTETKVYSPPLWHKPDVSNDPFVPQIHADGIELKAIDAEAGVKQSDCVVIVTDHKKFDYAKLVQDAKLIVDTRNALKGIESDKIVRL